MYYPEIRNRINQEGIHGLRRLKSGEYHSSSKSVIASSGQFSSAASQHSKNSQASGSKTLHFSLMIWKTLGQISAQLPQPMHKSSSTTGLIFYSISSIIAAASSGNIISWWPVNAYDLPPERTGRLRTFSRQR